MDNDKEVEKALNFMSKLAPYFGKSREELEQIIPDGAYDIDNGTYCLRTGKGGFINIILAMQEEINKYKTDVG